MSIWLGVKESNQSKFILSVKLPLCNILLYVKDDTKSISRLASLFCLRQLLLNDRYFLFGCILFFNVFSNTSSNNNTCEGGDPPSIWRSECRREFIWPFSKLLWSRRAAFFLYRDTRGRSWVTVKNEEQEYYIAEGEVASMFFFKQYIFESFFQISFSLCSNSVNFSFPSCRSFAFSDSLSSLWWTVKADAW